jgi:transcriptional regulator with XRE-family HTH domain
VTSFLVAESMNWQADPQPVKELQPIGALIRQARQRLGLSQYTLAERLAEVSGDDAVTREQVARWERGERIPRPYWRSHLSTALRVSRELLDRAAALARSVRSQRRNGTTLHETPLQPDARPTGGVGTRSVATEVTLTGACGTHDGVVQTRSCSRTLVETFDLWDGLMRRRDLLIGAGATAATLGFGAPLDPSAVAAATLNGFDPEALAAHVDLQAAHGRIDNMHGPAVVHAPATTHHHQLLAWYPHLDSATERDLLAGTLAVTGGFLGWLSFDLGHYGEATTLFRQAAALAADIGDISLCANNTGQASRALAHAGFRGEALQLSDAAVAIAGTAAHPAVRCWLHGVRALHHARVGDRQACLADLSAASSLLETVDDDKPGYIGYVDHAEIQKWTGHALVTLGIEHTVPGLLRSGHEAITNADAHWSPASVRGRAEVLATRAQSLMAVGDIDEAATRAWDAFRIATQTKSHRNEKTVRQLHGGLSAHRGSSAVRELTERMSSS